MLCLPEEYGGGHIGGYIDDAVGDGVSEKHLWVYCMVPFTLPPPYIRPSLRLLFLLASDGMVVPWIHFS